MPQHGQDRRPPHVRLLRAVIVGIVVLVVVVATAGGVAAWRLSRGPIVLDRVTPYLASALSSGPNGVIVTIDHTVLSWSDGRFHLFAQGVHLNQPASGAHLTFHGMEIVLSPWALLQGRLAPSRVVLDHPVLRLVRAADGSFRLALGEQTAESDTAEFWGTRLTRDVAAPLGSGGPLQYLTSFAMNDATLIVDDKSLGVTWRADRFDIAMERNAAGIAGTMQLAVGIAGKQALLSGHIDYRAIGQLSVKIDFDGVDPALFASAAPALQPLGTLDLPVSGEMALGFDTNNLAIDVAFCDFRFGAGTLREADLPDGTAAVHGGVLRASYNPLEGRVDIEDLELDLGGPKVSIQGEVDNLGNGLLGGGWPTSFDASARLTAAAIPIDSLPHLWPEHVGPHTRHWITTRVRDGMIDSVKAALALHVDTGAPKPVDVTRFDGTGSYHNLTIDYFPPLEPARGVGGTVVFDRTHMDFTPTGGHVLDGRATAASVKLYNLDTNDEMGDIDVTLAGPLRDALKVLDTKPLQYAKALGLDAEHAQGQFSAHIFFRLPLKHDLNFDEVVYRTEAQLSAVAIPHAFFGRDLSDGEFKMTLDRAALTLDGTAAIEGAPLKLTWVENLTKRGLRRRYTVQGRLDDAMRAHLGFDFADYATLKGPIDVDLAYGLGADRRAEASVTAKLKDAAVDIPKLGWHKPVGQPAVAKFTLELAGDQLTQLRNATLMGSGVNAQASATFDKAGLTRADIPHLVAGETNAQVTLARTGNGWTADLSGSSYDASGLLRDVSRPSAANPPPVAIHAKVGRLVLGPNRQLTDFSARLQSDGPHWTEAEIDSTLTGGKKLTVRFGGANGPGKFDLTADDFGALLRVLDVTGDVEGGTFAVKGDAVDDGGKRVLKGTFNGTDYRVVRAPLFARVLKLTSFTGVGDLLTGGSGIPFKALQGDIVYGAGEIKITNMRAYGGAVGINVDGTVNYDAGTLDASGTLVPANILNTVIGDIPVIGSLLMGGKGQGIIGANFRIAGAISDPQIAVNPLSVLAPGFLRNLFLFKAWNPAPDAPPKPDSSTSAGNP
ncbi:MAG TPA: AsmA-like C-terminal domain-containing protein [Stellaceae bacterium]|nr:AsmA-like C-terminal domain-containing protein [Stellaceae bacterium]